MTGYVTFKETKSDDSFNSQKSCVYTFDLGAFFLCYLGLPKGEIFWGDHLFLSSQPNPRLNVFWGIPQVHIYKTLKQSGICLFNYGALGKSL